MHREASQEWNPSKTVPLRDWLMPTLFEEDKKRLVAVGNVVFPKAAQLAAHVIGAQICSGEA